MNSEVRWLLTQHVCRSCLGRVLARTDEDVAAAMHRCSDCGCEATGGVESLCACGALPAGSRVRLRCAPNENRTAASPSEIIVIEAAASA